MYVFHIVERMRPIGCNQTFWSHSRQTVTRRWNQYDKCMAITISVYVFPVCVRLIWFAMYITFRTTFELHNKGQWIRTAYPFMAGNDMGTCTTKLQKETPRLACVWRLRGIGVSLVPSRRCGDLRMSLPGVITAPAQQTRFFNGALHNSLGGGGEGPPP